MEFNTREEKEKKNDKNITKAQYIFDFSSLPLFDAYFFFHFPKF